MNWNIYIGIVLGFLVLFFIVEMITKRSSEYRYLEECFFNVPRENPKLCVAHALCIGGASYRSILRIGFSPDGVFIRPNLFSCLYKNLFIPYDYFYLSDGLTFIKAKKYVYFSTCPEILEKIRRENIYGNPTRNFPFWMPYKERFRLAVSRLPRLSE
jgi:hypothetical protein